MDIKIIFFDIDGTLIPFDKKISLNTIQTLKMLKARGVKLVLATGRSPMLVPHFEGVDFDAFLTYNGSYCYDKEQEIFKKTLDRDDVLIMVANAQEINRPVSLATGNRLVANGIDEDLKQYYAFSNLDITISTDFDLIAAEEEVYQIMLGCRQKDYPTLLKNVKSAKIVAWWDKAVDIIPASIDKGKAVGKILQHYHLTKEQSMAFGDGNNDVQMLKAVGRGIAMGNGSEQLKEIADDICPEAADDGIYFYCKEHKLI